MTSVYSARSAHTNRSVISARSTKSANAAPPKISRNTTSPQTMCGSDNKFLKKNVAKMFTNKKEESSARTRMQEYQAGVLKTTQQKTLASNNANAKMRQFVLASKRDATPPPRQRISPMTKTNIIQQISANKSILSSSSIAQNSTKSTI